MSEETKSSSGRMAKNWGRRDNIRAGAVSGPWRSAPSVPTTGSDDSAFPVRRGGPNAEAGNISRRVEPPVPDQCLDPIGTHGSQEVPPADAANTSPVQVGPARVRQSARLYPAILGGTLFALAIVAGAVFIRGEMSRGVAAEGPSVQTDSDSDIVKTEPRSVPDVAMAKGEGVTLGEDAEFSSVSDSATAGVAPAPLPRQIQSLPAQDAVETFAVRLRLGPNFPENDRAQLLELLEQSGHERIMVEEISFPIALSRVGYYLTADRPAAVELAEDVAGVVGGDGGEVAVRDYGNLLPDAEPGRLDLWVKSP